MCVEKRDCIGIEKRMDKRVYKRADKRANKMGRLLMTAAAAFFFTACGYGGEPQEDPAAVTDMPVQITAVPENTQDEAQGSAAAGTPDKAPAETEHPTEEAPAEAESPAIDIYEHILAQYKDMVQNDFYEDLLGTDIYDSSFGEDIGFEIRTYKQNIFYALYDIDGNGTMELIIAGGENGASNSAFSPWNYDLYGYNGTKAVHIFPEMEFGYRTNFSLYENGIIEVFYSGSAAESGVDFYRIGSDGFTPELVDSFAAVGHLEGEEPVFTYSQNGNEITGEEYSARIQSYAVTLTAGLDWIQIQ